MTELNAICQIVKASYNHNAIKNSLFADETVLRSLIIAVLVKFVVINDLLRIIIMLKL